MDKLTREVAQKLVDEGYSLTEIADQYNVTTSWVSQLFKIWELKAPPPGHRKGKPQSEETKIKIGNTIRKKQV